MGEFTIISVFKKGARAKSWFCDQTGKIFVTDQNETVRQIKFGVGSEEVAGNLDLEWKNQFVRNHFRKEYVFGGDDSQWLGRFGFQEIDLALCEVVYYDFRDGAENFRLDQTRVVNFEGMPGDFGSQLGVFAGSHVQRSVEGQILAQRLSVYANKYGSDEALDTEILEKSHEAMYSTLENGFQLEFDSRTEIMLSYDLFVEK
jgi:hypothetical protein